MVMPISTENICSVEKLFPNAEESIKGEPWGYAINRGGPHGFDTKSPYWDKVDDPLAKYNNNSCVICLVKFLDGSPVVVRYYKSDVIKF